MLKLPEKRIFECRSGPEDEIVLVEAMSGNDAALHFLKASWRVQEFEAADIQVRPRDGEWRDYGCEVEFVPQWNVTDNGVIDNDKILPEED